MCIRDRILSAALIVLDDLIILWGQKFLEVDYLGIDLLPEDDKHAKKLEGGREVCPQIKAIVDASIPVCAHLGLTPQSVNAFGGFKDVYKRQEYRHSF